MAVRGVRDELDTDKSISRRNDTSLQDTVTTTTAAKEAGGEEDMTMKAVLPRLIDAVTSASNLAFLTVTEAATTS
ncbi:hypothetical protein BDDG_11660 [Blastomyces dermatitidis ATCC 18188]|uniref:Uncharacterized protein n=1 Tax=Ajellomyces dermatitidis (strain ATCC 18188 / CBS 674.68) TaxID=653446 RepID=A0A0J9HCC8_AJEDA|nr:hypothetical protein BDDG_11660 [Blastomyces dermatitidis ATCC 18188]